MNPTLLSDRDLLAMLIGNSQAERMYRGSLAALLEPESGDGHDMLFAAQEFVRRTLGEEITKRDSLSNPLLVRNYLRLALNGKEHEVFYVLFLDARNCLLKAEEVFRGTLNQAAVYPREVVKMALKLNAGNVIVAHNHPSGSPDPSSEDFATTRKLKDSLALVGIGILDHFLIAGGECVSFAERGWL